MDELKFAVKQWERDFFKAYGHKPSTADVAANEAVHDMYRRYKYVARGLPTTPTKLGVAAIDPTPQKTGKALGLFDVQLPSSSPMKSPQKVSTPRRNNTRPIETPPSKRTPAYLADGGARFVDDDSPLLLLGKRRRSLALRPVTEDTEEADETAANTAALLAAESANTADQIDNFEKNLPESSSRAEAETPTVLQGPTPPGSSSPQPVKDDTHKNSDIETEEAHESPPDRVQHNKHQRKGPKRSTRRVVMRPVQESDQLARGKPKENFKRLRIQKPTKGKFRRRR